MEELFAMVFHEGVPEGFQENLNLAIQREAWKKTKVTESKKPIENKTQKTDNNTSTTINQGMIQNLLSMVKLNNC